MSKVEKTVVEETTNEVSTVINNLTPQEIAGSGNVGELLKGMKKENFSLTSEYLEMEVGQVSRFVAMQVGKMIVDKQVGETVEQKELDCIIMVDEENKTKRSAQTVIVSSLRDFVPCAVEIEYLGEVKTAKGKYQSFNITRLSN